MRWALGCAAAVAGVWLASAGARADTVIFARSGQWDAFGGTSADGTPVCGISTSWDDGRYFGVKYYKGNDTVVIQLGSNDWRVRDGASQEVVFWIDDRSDWNGRAGGIHFTDNQAGLEFGITRAQLSTFVAEFREGEELTFSFPNTTASNWVVGLRGTDSVMTSFANCIDAM